MLIQVGRPTASSRTLENAARKAAILRNPLGNDAPEDRRGPGLTEPIGPNASRLVEILTDPENIRVIYGNQPFIKAAIRRKELEDAGARGRYTGAPGMSKTGDMQYMGHMPKGLYLWLMGIDPSIFQDEQRLARLLHRMKLGVRQPHAV